MTATMPKVATIKGTFVVPGVSKNGRWYKPEHISVAVSEAQAAIDSGETLAMLTHHGARDPRGGDVTRTVGRITKVGLSPEGHGIFEAELADTAAGRDVAALVMPAKPHLRGVSMAALLKGTPRQVVGPGGQLCETADGFSLKGIDFTHSPGVPGAEIKTAEITESSRRGLIFESIDDVSPKGTQMTDTDHTDEIDPRRMRLAQQLVEQVQVAESKPLRQASIQDLEALTAAAFGI